MTRRQQLRGGSSRPRIHLAHFRASQDAPDQHLHVVLRHIGQRQFTFDDFAFDGALQNFRQALHLRFGRRIAGAHAVAEKQVVDQIGRKVHHRAVRLAHIGQGADAALRVAGVGVVEMRSAQFAVGVVNAQTVFIEQAGRQRIERLAPLRQSRRQAAQIIGTPDQRVADPRRLVRAGDVAERTAGGADIDFADKAPGRTALIEAVIGGHADAVRLLVARGAKLNATDRTLGYTALGWAARSGNLSIVEQLLAAGASVEVTASEFQLAPLMVAAKV